MPWNIQLETRDIILLLAVILGTGMLLSALLALWVIWRVRKINLPPDADPITALLATPFAVVLLLDLLDFSLDFLSAPFAWTLLGYLGLKPLRGITIIESIIPGTQAIPTMTLAWLFVRLVRPNPRRPRA